MDEHAHTAPSGFSFTERISVRRERPGDFDAIDHLLREAFLDAPFSDHTEHELVHRLRRTTAYIPDLALVADFDHTPIGYVMMTAAEVMGRENTSKIALLAPLAVLPDFRGLGIGRRLMHEAHAEALRHGFPAVVLIGMPEFYAPLGYRPCSDFGLIFRDDVPDRYTLAMPLTSDAIQQGIVLWDKAFDE